MEKSFVINEKSVEYRFDGISGPKYLLRGPRADVGMVILVPNEDFQTHYHRKVEEDFYTLEGEVDIYINAEKITLKAGDLCHVPPMHPHYLINNGKTPWKAIFVKAGYDPKDKVDVDWLPGQELPEIS